MKLNPYLAFPGNCEEAFKFYEKCLGGKTLFSMTYGESPMAEKTPADWHTKVLHARFEVDGQTLMGCDATPERYHKPQGLTVTLNIVEPADAERVYKMLSENGTIHMPMEETFWAHRFAMFIDQYGIPWMINCEKSM